MQNVDIFAQGSPMTTNYFSFKNVGDKIQGTYVAARLNIHDTKYNNFKNEYDIQT